MLKTKYGIKLYSKWHHCVSLSLFTGQKNSSSHCPYVLNLNSCRFRWDLPHAKGHGTRIANFPLYFLNRNVLLRDILFLLKSAACDLQLSSPVLPQHSKWVNC